MTTVPFALVDVFSDRPLAGNPLAVVPDADQLDEAVMAAIAREFNQSETTFLVAPTLEGAEHRLRSFTPAGVEVFGAGHNALGAWWWLADNGRLDRWGVWHQQLGSVVLPVEVDADRIAMRQEPARYGSAIAPGPLAAALGIETAAMSVTPQPQVVDTGAGHLLVGVRDRVTVDAVSPDTAALKDILLAAGGEGCYVYSLESGAVTAYARFFNPVAGIVEDPATGTAAGPLASLLHKHGVAGETSAILQGHRLGRPSQLEVRLDAGTPVLSGRAVVSATGTLRLP